jgi:aminopeptidase N
VALPGTTVTSLDKARNRRARDEEKQMSHFTANARLRLMLMAVSVAALLAAASIPLLADTFPRQPGIKVLDYTFDVTLSDASDEISVKDTVDLRILADGVDGVNLNLCNSISKPQAPDRLNPCLQPVPRVRAVAGAPLVAPTGPTTTNAGRGMTVTAVTHNGEALSFEHRDNLLRVRFPAGVRAGETFSFTVSYHGVPATGLFVGKNQYGGRVWFTDNWPNKARNWLATIDHISVKAPKTITVTAPQGYHVISNGLVKEETDLPNGLRSTTWDESEPIPSWQYSLGVAAMAVEYFGKFHGTEFSAWVFPQDKEKAFRAFDEKTASIFEFYTDHIGPFSYEKLAQVQATGAGGATEPATSIFYYGNSFGAVAHEMAHQWFGDAVTERDWDDVWLSEGFATYFSLLYTEHQDGRDVFLAGVKRTRDAAVKYELAHPDDTVVHNNLQNDSNVFSNSTQIYQGGAMVLHTLRGVIGDDLFWAGIRLYYSRFRNGRASSDDLRHAMEDACIAAGNCPQDHQDLSWFFHEWLNRGGILKVQGSWHYDAASKQLHVTLDQEQTQGLYRMPVQIGIVVAPSVPESSDAARRRQDGPEMQKATILLDKQESSLTIPLDVAPSAVQLDPDLWVPLMQSTFEAR